ncbi:MAG TPA: glycosyltransferase [Patescibacteria group bacterium]|nr:glycosyltransferase [Patescibacteria group bacterium]
MKNLASIFHVTPSYPPALGGMEKVVQILAKIQAKAGRKVAVLTSKQAAANVEKNDGPTVSRLKTFTAANTRIMPSLPLKLLHLGRNDVVHLHFASAFAPEIVWLMSKMKGFSYVAHMHLDFVPTGRFGFLVKFYKRFVLKHVLRSAGAVVVFTEDQRTAFSQRYGVAISKIEVIPNGVEEKFYSDTLRSLHKKTRLLFVGRLELQKNLPQLLRALKGVSEQFETTLVGEGSLEGDLKALVKELKLKNVKFVGRADGQKLLNYYKDADIFVLPSELEGMPLVLLEAMAMGLPIVATDVTGTRDVVEDDENGFLVPYGDTEKFRAALLKTGSDKKLYEKLSRKSRIMADKYSWDKVALQFEKLYEKILETPKQKTIKIWQLYAPLLVVANLAYMSRGIFGAAITLGFFLLAPGYLLLRSLNHGIKSSWEVLSFSLGLSILLFMIAGLLLDSLHALGLNRPLTTFNVFAALNIITLALLVFTRRSLVVLPTFWKLNRSSGLKISITGLLTLLPLLAVGGAVRLNNGGSNILTMCLFALISLIFVLLVWKEDLKPIYPYAILMAALAILLSTSQRGWFITGHDIQHEYMTFRAVASNGFWSSTTSNSDPYNACLSITILPTMLAKLTSISLPFIYKVIFQVIFAFGLLPIYFILKRLSRSTYALIGALIFISFPPFLNDMPFLNRQEIAFIFFGLLVLATFMNIGSRLKTIFTVAFFIGLLLSHYSSSYVALALLLFAWAIYHMIAAIFLKKSFSEKLPLLSLPLLVAIFLLTFLWNTQVTASTAGLKRTVTQTISGLIHHSSAQSSGVTYGLVSQKVKAPSRILAEHAGPHASDVHYRSEQNLPLTNVGRMTSHVIKADTLNKAIRAFSARILQILLIAGLVICFFNYRKKATQHQVYMYTLMLSSFIMLVMITLLPQLSVDYSVTRLFQQTLLLTALPIIVATSFCFRALGKYQDYAIVVFFAFLFLDLSGFVPQSLGGYPPQLALNNAGTYYDIYYVHKGELAGAAWLSAANHDTPVAADLYAHARVQQYPIKNGVIDPIFSHDRPSYLYLDYTNTQNGLYANFLSGNVIEYTNPSAATGRNLLYSDQASLVYGK